MSRFLPSLAGLLCCLLVVACGGDPASDADFEAEVQAYIQKFPYQETYRYAMQLTGGDASKLNAWSSSETPALIKAGEDTIVRTNNDTYYKMAFVRLDAGPVVVTSAVPAEDRFVSFQLMDDRNANYRNVTQPSGAYTLYTGTKPAEIQGEAIEVPSALSVVLVRVEVKDGTDEADVAAAKAVFHGITIQGPTLDEAPRVDLLSGYSQEVADEAERRIDEAFAATPFLEMVVGPDKVPGKDVSFLKHAAGTKGGWGGPDPSHSSYETVQTDAAGNVLDGSRGTYTFTTPEPPVEGFWSVTVYDTARGGTLHPNEQDRYHINDTTAVMNDDGTVTFTFKTSCGDGDRNCLEVPAGPFDLAIRYYLPAKEIQTGAWTMPRPRLEEE